MSALPPKADIVGRDCVISAKISSAEVISTERFDGLEIDPHAHHQKEATVR
jgi:hypothetical protein